MKAVLGIYVLVYMHILYIYIYIIIYIYIYIYIYYIYIHTYMYIYTYLCVLNVFLKYPISVNSVTVSHITSKCVSHYTFHYTCHEITRIHLNSKLKTEM